MERSEKRKRRNCLPWKTGLLGNACANKNPAEAGFLLTRIYARFAVFFTAFFATFFTAFFATFFFAAIFFVVFVSSVNYARTYMQINFLQ